MAGLFARWQPEYAAHGLPVFPVDADHKKPLVSQYNKGGLRASRQWAGKFADADAMGLMCGQRTGLTVLDVDTTDERVLADAIAHFGPSPVVIQTASGKFHAWYRWNGERRSIRTALPGQPIDILGGGGLTIVPPSRTGKGQYRFLQGSLSDLATLPKMLRPLGALAPLPNKLPAIPDVVPVGARNATIWRALMQAAPSIPTFEGLMDHALAVNSSGLQEPLPHDEILKIAGSAWAKTAAGENWFGKGGRLILSHDRHDALQNLGPDPFALAMKLRREHWGRSSFYVADAMAEAMPGGRWARKRFSAARKALLDNGELVRLRSAAPNCAALYRFGEMPSCGGQGKGGEGC